MNDSDTIFLFFTCFPPFWRETGALTLCQQVSFTNQQVAECGQKMQPAIVLGKAATADLAITKNLVDAPEGMLHFGTNTGFDLSAFSVLRRWVPQVIEQLHAVNSQHGRQRMARPAILALRVRMNYRLFQLFPRDQLVRPFQKDLPTGFALLDLVLGVGESDLMHGGNESYELDDGGISLISRLIQSLPKLIASIYCPFTQRN